MAIYQLDEKEIWFPLPSEAEEDGLLAVGGDLSLDRLLLAPDLVVGVNAPQIVQAHDRADA